MKQIGIDLDGTQIDVVVFAENGACVEELGPRAGRLVKPAARVGRRGFA